jgi:hypothetical protein
MQSTTGAFSASLGAAMTAVLENALRALPPAPDGWVLVGDNGLYVQPNVCQDDEGRPFSLA